ncbi:MAG TPA: dihydrolipoamide acetyltransferase family protein [Actinomycetota bacterium]|nr:dihydrolipoamide acetyltransferase family protein [Actinomycetota bacterium]
MAERVFRLPDLGEGLEEAEVVQWLVAEGETVELNQPLVEVNTEKALVEIPSPFEGRVAKLHAEAGAIVRVGSAFVTFEVADTEAGADGAQAGLQAAMETSPEEVAPDLPDAATGTAAGAGANGGGPRRRAVLVGYGVAEDEDETPPPPAAAVERGGPVSATPPVRRLAKDLGVDLAAVDGSGPNGRVTREDVERAAASATGVPAPAWADGADVERIPVRGVRRLVAEKMTRSVREIPHVTTFLTVDCSQLAAFREELERRNGRRISPLAVVVRALVEVVGRHPLLNASFDQAASEIVVHRAVHAGVATDTERGLMVPVVRDAGGKGILAIADEIGRLSEAARAGSITPDALGGSTITVSNVGTFGAEFGTPIINHPESAILATGVIEPRALVVDGEVVARPAMTMSLSFDHRLLDGAQAGRALRDLADLLESPFELGRLPR